MNKLLLNLAKTIALAGILCFSTVNLTASAQSISTNDSLATPNFKVSITSCFYDFDWNKFVESYKVDLSRPVSDQPVLPSNPYNSYGCASDSEFANNGTRTINRDANGQVNSVKYDVGQTIIKKPKYSDFSVIKAETKNLIGDLPVLAIAVNAGKPAQSLNTYNFDGSVMTAGSNSDRSQLANLTSIFTENELKELYGPQTQRTGAPRLAPVYTLQSPYSCSVENGRFVVPSTLGEPNSAITSCKWSGYEDTLFDQPLDVYQFLYRKTYPSYDQCSKLRTYQIQRSSNPKRQLTPDLVNSCIDFYKTILGKSTTGSTIGNGIYATFTYYGMYADMSFICKTAGAQNCDQTPRWGTLTSGPGVDRGWKNPDINGPRKNFNTNATEAQLRALYNDSTSSYQQLQDKYNGVVRNAERYSVYNF
jgi:hypothetical protein